jgi:hypothetical protein
MEKCSKVAKAAIGVFAVVEIFSGCPAKGQTRVCGLSPCPPGASNGGIPMGGGGAPAPQQVQAPVAQPQIQFVPPTQATPVYTGLPPGVTGVDLNRMGGLPPGYQYRNDPGGGVEPVPGYDPGSGMNSHGGSPGPVVIEGDTIGNGETTAIAGTYTSTNGNNVTFETRPDGTIVGKNSAGNIVFNGRDEGHGVMTGDWNTKSGGSTLVQVVNDGGKIVISNSDGKTLTTLNTPPSPNTTGSKSEQHTYTSGSSNPSSSGTSSKNGAGSGGLTDGETAGSIDMVLDVMGGGKGTPVTNSGKHDK